MSNVMYNEHSIASMGDISHMGNLKGEKRDFSSKENLAKSENYHFHATMQSLEDGLQEQWKEQNRNMNKDRTNPISSMTDAGFRKLVTTMIYPVTYNLGSMIMLFMLIPFVFAFKTKYTMEFTTLGVILSMALLFSICFDAYVIYRSRKYVIEKVTSRYYKILKKGWRTFEVLAVIITLVITVFLISMIEHFFYFETSINLLNKFINQFDYEVYRFASFIIMFISFPFYILFVMNVSRKAAIANKKSIMEARSASEHNADVASQVINDTLGDFEDE